jgi:Mce-associated membrane protein
MTRTREAARAQGRDALDDVIDDRSTLSGGEDVAGPVNLPETAEPAATDETPAGDPPGRRGPGTIVVVTLALLLVLVLAGVGYLLVQSRYSSAHADDRADAVQAARQLVMNLMTLDHTNPQASLDRVLAASSGEFREQFGSQVAAIQNVLKEAQVSSSGDVTEAGLATLDGDRATVLVAASALVKNTETPDGEPRQYRMSVTLQRDSDAWSVSNVEFVP